MEKTDKEQRKKGTLECYCCRSKFSAVEEVWKNGKWYLVCFNCQADQKGKEE